MPVVIDGTAGISSTGDVVVNGVSEVGYSTGAGGTVTQTTSKSTAVTLNKPTGQITMNNAALATSAWVTFTFNNSIITTTDNLLVTGSGFTGPYRISVDGIAAGSCRITVQNLNAASQSDALLLNFAVIKGATS